MQSLFQEVAPLRQASREMVRELGFLQAIYLPAEMPYSHSHVLLELGHCGVLNQNELGERLQLEKSSISRIIRQLSDIGLVQVIMDLQDKRVKQVSLTEAGQKRLQRIHDDANQRVQAALALLQPEQRSQVVAGLELYARALNRSRLQNTYAIRPIQAQDNPGVAHLIRRVMPEFGASGPGFALHDPEVDQMFDTYSQSRHAYFVVHHQGLILGGGGIAPLSGGDHEICELRKMYFMPELRGLGLGQKMMDTCLAAARQLGFKQCYLETLKTMTQAQGLYAKNGFQPLAKPLGNTGHFSCDSWFLLSL
jgi:putative acetyltransferase